MNSSNKKRLVIVGSGFAGLYTYLSIPKKTKRCLDITIIDQRNHFLFTPLVHEVATGSLSQNSVVESTRSLIDPFCTRFVQAKIESADLDKKTVRADGLTFEYDFLVLAMGSKTNYLNTPGAKEHAFALKDLRDAVNLRNHIIDVFEKASLTDGDSLPEGTLSFVVVGGGPTGVEVAAELSDWFYKTFTQYYKNVRCSKRVKLYLLNSGPNLLKQFNKKIQINAEKILQEKKVIVKNNATVKEVSSNSVRLDSSEEIKSENIIWTAGVKACSVPIYPDFPYGNLRLPVDQFFRLNQREAVFVLGDLAKFKDSSGNDLPMMAQVATQEGVLMGKNIARILKKKKLKPFKFKKYGDLVSIGHWQAAANIAGLTFFGFIAWFIWRTVYLFNFATWTKRFKIMVDWTINFFSPRDITRI